MMSNSRNHVNNNHEAGEKKPSTNSRGGGGGGATTFSGKSMSTSGSVGSPSSRSEAAMATPASDNTFLGLNNLDIQGDDDRSQGAMRSAFKFFILFVVSIRILSLMYFLCAAYIIS